IPAGHLLGAANIIVHAVENGVEKSIAFTGDLGRNDYPLLVDPQGIPNVDYLVCESTYGNRNHTDEGNPEDLLEDIIARTCVDKPGRLIIPAFSVGRTQSLLFTLNKLSIERRLPSIRVFADSPMAEQSTLIYQNHVGYMNEDARKFSEVNEGLFDFDNLICTSGHAESKAISNYNQPSIIIASSGMLTGGRMNYHIRKNMGNPYCSIMFIGYCAEGTPGHQLTQNKTLRVQGRDIPVDAKILHTDIYSGHADCRDLTRFIKGINKTQLKKIFLVHGDYESMKGLSQILHTDGYAVEIPEKGQQYVLI
ncbi:MAG: MBL fold metallo-hydrolase RNA specificity domain-containing protein, partial [Cytophagaceae bacterium]